MAGVRIRVDVDDDEVRRVLGMLAEPLGRGVWARVGQTLVSSTIGRFESGRGPDDAPWKPSRRAAAEGGQTLVDTSRLRDSVTFRASAEGVEVGTNVVYAAIHQFGSAAGGGRPRGIPARPFLGIDDRDRDEILDIVLDALERRAAAAFLAYRRQPAPLGTHPRRAAAAFLGVLLPRSAAQGTAGVAHLLASTLQAYGTRRRRTLDAT